HLPLDCPSPSLARAPAHQHLHSFPTRRSSDLQRLVERLLNGDDLALISDAGTPLISDPGFHLVRQAREAGVRVCPVPGACALIRSEEHTSELQSRENLVCRLLRAQKKIVRGSG